MTFLIGMIFLIVCIIGIANFIHSFNNPDSGEADDDIDYDAAANIIDSLYLNRDYDNFLDLLYSDHDSDIELDTKNDDTLSNFDWFRENVVYRGPGMPPEPRCHECGEPLKYDECENKFDEK